MNAVVPQLRRLMTELGQPVNLVIRPASTPARVEGPEIRSV